MHFWLLLHPHTAVTAFDTSLGFALCICTDKDMSFMQVHWDKSQPLNFEHNVYTSFTVWVCMMLAYGGYTNCTVPSDSQCT